MNESREPDAKSDTGRSPTAAAAVGEPLVLAEARFLAHELEQLGIPSRRRKVPAAGLPEDPAERLYRLEVAPSDLDAALAARERLLGDDEEVNAEGGSDAGGPRQRFRARSFAFFVLGSVAGLRVASHLHGSPWLGILLGLALGVLGFGAGELFGGERPS